MSTPLRLRLRLRVSPEFVMDVFDAEGSTWLIVQNKPLGILRCWSMALAPDPAVHHFGAQLARRLNDMGREDALLFFVDGWKTWGGGMAGPIAQLFLSGELERARTEARIEEVAHAP